MELSGQQDLLSCSWNPESSPASPARSVSPASFPLGSPSPGVHLGADCWALLSLGPGPGRRAGAAGLLWGLLLTSASPWSALPRPVAKAGSARGPLPGGRWAAGLGSFAGGGEWSGFQSCRGVFTRPGFHSCPCPPLTRSAAQSPPLSTAAKLLAPPTAWTRPGVPGKPHTPWCPLGVPLLDGAQPMVSSSPLAGLLPREERVAGDLPSW